LAIEAKVYGSETAVRVLTNLMRIVGVESYHHALPVGRLLQDALALPLFAEAMSASDVDGSTRSCNGRNRSVRSLQPG